MADAKWDYVAVVPSTRSRAGDHPLEQALGRLKNWPYRLTRCLEPGDAVVGHGHSDDRAFTVSAPVAGQRILLIDDTFTTGARVQSAASALQLAGAVVPAAIAIGRVMNPDFNIATKTVWERASTTPYSFDHCCLE